MTLTSSTDLQGMTALERDVYLQLISHELSPFVKEHRWHPTRKWRFDFAWVQELVALEVEGGAFSGGRHTRGGGFHKDLDKYNEAALHGWLVIRVTPAHVRNGDHLKLVRRALVSRSEKWAAE